MAEIQPADLTTAWRAYGVLFYIAGLGMVLLFVRVISQNRPIELTVLLWSITMFSAYFTSVRFGYYVAVIVAILAGFTIWWTAHNLLNLSFEGSITEIEVYQVVGILIILIAVVPGNVIAVDNRQPVWETADRFSGADTAWQNELHWVNGNTPEVPLAYTERFSKPDDGDFAYPAGAYGVMSWWDYGHWITVAGERIPFANPFQEGPVPASAYLQAQNETRANLILEALPSMHSRDDSVAKLSNDQLREIISGQSDQNAAEDIRYVMIDDLMMAGKFAAIATWTGPGYSSYVSRQEFRLQGGQQTAALQGMNRQYHQTMMARMYFGDAQGMEHYRLVHESETTTTFVSVAQQTQGGWQSTGFINRRLSSQIFTTVQQRPDLNFYDVRQASRVKIFERVTGATIDGQVNTTNQTTVFVTLQLRTNTGRNITYIQQGQTDNNGQFSITVPYPTDNTVGTANGGTDAGVTARGPYTVFADNPIRPSARGKVTVPESAVYAGETRSVELEPVEIGNQSTSETEG